MRIFLDTEFLDDGARINLISIALVAEDGREFYAVSAEFDQATVKRHGWLMANVWPSLPTFKHNRPGEPVVRCACGPGHLDLTHPDVRPRAQIARAVHQFILNTPTPELWAYYAASDHVVLYQLFGPMTDLPTGIPSNTRDLVQEAQRLGLTPADLPRQPDGLHNALADARHNHTRALFLDTAARTEAGRR